MVLMAPPVVDCVEAVRKQSPDPGHLIMLTPQGRRLTQGVVEELAQHQRLLLLCGGTKDLTNESGCCSNPMKSRSEILSSAAEK